MVWIAIKFLKKKDPDGLMAVLFLCANFRLDMAGQLAIELK